MTLTETALPSTAPPLLLFLGQPPTLDVDDLCTHCDKPAEEHVADGQVVPLREFHRLGGIYSDEIASVLDLQLGDIVRYTAEVVINQLGDRFEAQIFASDVHGMGRAEGDSPFAAVLEAFRLLMESA